MEVNKVAQDYEVVISELKAAKMLAYKQLTTQLSEKDREIN
eukprot:CAMPEP_0183324242 /NCGR_PEP_ID=MMETSP0160_2-20130417/76495_1 /TAXON_ID=2839 ORGANISM="Odontella Sinensis, Strain Grunow 1884" /NCGR_SAMPLE_ID=MMETSP0160_2 /ASSEMBLY_ACC=CAM_ASM_000250 /LENGTH=40 /DNA_ID= /DNA_START= /DNA_END= /DNA_ORIENTATION=